MSFPHQIEDFARLEMDVKIDHERPLLWQRIRITNTSKEPLLVNRMNFAQLKLDPGFYQAIEIKTHYASLTPDSAAVPLGIEDPAVTLYDATLQKGMLVGSMAAGLLRRLLVGEYLSLGYTHGDVRFETTLQPAESFESDWAFFLFYQEDAQEASYWLIRFIQRLQRAACISFVWLVAMGIGFLKKYQIL